MNSILELQKLDVKNEPDMTNVSTCNWSTLSVFC